MSTLPISAIIGYTLHLNLRATLMSTFLFFIVVVVSEVTVVIIVTLSVNVTNIPIVSVTLHAIKED
jgi:hypothetical protein